MALAIASPHMASETSVFGLMTAVIIGGSLVLLTGVGAFAETNMILVGVGGAIMVVGILGMAGYVEMLPDVEGHEGESGH